MSSFSSPDVLRVKTKFGAEIRRFTLQRESLSYDVLKSEIGRIHGLHPAAGQKTITLEKLRNADGPFLEDHLQTFLKSGAPQLALSVKAEVEIENLPRSSEMMNMFKKEEAKVPPKSRPIPNRVAQSGPPRPWPKNKAPGDLPKIIYEKKGDSDSDPDSGSSDEDFFSECGGRKADELDPPPIISERYKRNVTLFVNGQKHVIKDVEPDTLLAQWLRTHLFASTKIACGEGGCGACTVVLSFISPITGKLTHLSTNACMRLLLSCDGMHITNSHGIGNEHDGFHPLQIALAEENGSQCGFCSTGMVAQMFSLLLKTRKPSIQEVEDNFQGNLCRCTGYRPIYKAFRRFAVPDSPNGIPQDNIQNTLKDDIQKIESSELSRTPQPIYFRRHNKFFFRPVTLADVFILERFYAPYLPIRFVNNNTSIGVVKYYPFDPKHDDPQVFIDISHIPALTRTRVTNSGLEVGSAVPINTLIQLLEDNARRSSTFQQFADHLKVVATIQIRNFAVWAGNLMIAQTHPDFPSDILLLTMALGVKLRILGPRGNLREVTMEQFLANGVGTSSIIQSMFIPFADDSVKFLSFKIRQRDQNSHPIINACFVAQMSRRRTVERATVLFGGLQPGPKRIAAVERFVIGKSFTNAMVQEAIKILLPEVVPVADGIFSKQFRQNLCVNLFYKFALFLQDPNMLPPDVVSAATPYTRPISMGTQTLAHPNPDIEPVSNPVTHLAAFRQAAGDAVYTDDIQPLAGSVWAAPVLSTQARARIVKIDLSRAMAVPGVIGFISAKDVWEIGGSNDVGQFPGDEEIFASTEVFTVGQCIGLLITDSEDSALGEKSALLVDVTYASANEEPIVSLQDGISRRSFLPPRPDIGPFFSTIEQGDVERGLREADHMSEGQFFINGQSHFYMEAQSAIAFPDEDEVLKVICACQGAGVVNGMLTTALGMPSNHIVVETRRCGGAYGGKLTRDHPLIAAVAVAAKRLNRPVRCRQERVVDFKSVGGRHQYSSAFRVGYNDDGKITAFDMDYFMNAGFSYDLSPGILDLTQTFIDNCYNIPNFKTHGQLVKTNMPSFTAMRAPGHVQGPFLMENVIEHVARVSGLDASLIREQNFYQDGDTTPYMQPITFSTLDKVWFELKRLTNVDKLMAEVEQFNMENKFRKRGLAMVPTRFGLDQQGVRTAALVNIHGADGTVTVTTSGTEIGQGLWTKVAQSVAFKLGVSLDMIRMSDISTNIMVNTDLTGGSTGSEMCVQAAMNACDKLNERLMPFKLEMPDATWEELVAVASRVEDLSATGFFVGMDEFVHTYFVWTAGLTIAEIDTLTGETQILRSDVVYDAGVSMNPDVDIGQIEGAFVTGIGFVTTEEVIYNPDGSIATLGTWDYKPPCSKTIPQQLNVTFLDNVSNPLGILGSKATGEPPLVTGACSVFFALKNAIAAARADSGTDEEFEMDTPASPERVQLLSSVTPNMLTF